jgi:hypothetical protein
MTIGENYEIGILAFGSLIDNPGEEILKFEVHRINCQTPFKIEFARLSSSRSNAPTLIPILDGSRGKIADSKIIVINEKISLSEAKSMLWRRECHINDVSKKYSQPKTPTSKNVLIGELDDFYNIKKVIYTYFLIQDEYADLKPLSLAQFAINSILNKAGEEEKDGIRYLLAIKSAGIKTEYSEEYEKLILYETKTKSLDEAIKKLDEERIKTHKK